MTGCLVGVVTRLAGGGSAAGVASGSDDGTGSAATFYSPRGIAVSTSGTVYVADTLNHLIRVISPTGTVVVVDHYLCWHIFILICLSRCGDSVGWWRECYWYY